MTTTTTNTAAKTAALSYIYTDTLRKFTFYQLPKTLFEDNGYQLISNDSKLLYSMMLDRAGLSAQNGWTDSARRVFIYFKMEEAIGKLHIGHNKAVKLYKELETCGMIERKKQGLGKPDMIYVKVFPAQKQTALMMESAEETEEEYMAAYLPVEECVEERTQGECAVEYPSVLTAQKVDFCRNDVPDTLPKMGRRPSALGNPGLPENGTLDFPKPVSNNIKGKKKELMKNQSINPHAPVYRPPLPKHYASRYSQNWLNERLKDAEDYREMIHNNIDYDILCQDYPEDMELIDGYVDLMVEVCCSQRKTCRINREEYPMVAVKSCFKKLTRGHILYVKERMENNPTQIRNIRAYTLSALFNSYTTLTQYYTSQVSHDMAQDSYERMRQ